MSNSTIKNVFPTIPKIVGFPKTSPKMVAAATFLASYLRGATQGKKKIVLFGDFDTDGTCSTAILFFFTKLLKIESAFPYISKRTEGYGLTAQPLERLMKENWDAQNTLVVLMDLGVSSTTEVETLLKKGYSVLVIDHHVPRPGADTDWEELYSKYSGDKVCVYDPQLYSGELEQVFLNLPAAGLVYKILFSIMESNIDGLAEDIFKDEKVTLKLGYPSESIDAIFGSMSKLCSMAIAADCVDLVKNGEVTVAWGLAKDFEVKTPLTAGIKTLYKITNTASQVAMRTTPIINAAGRLEDGYSAVELMLEISEEEAEKKLQILQEIRNKVRGKTKFAAQRLDEDLATKKGVAVLLGNSNNIGPGVVGIVAARAADKFSSPALYLCEQQTPHGSIYKGSMRSGKTDFSCEKWIISLKEKGFLLAGGGHKAAAGLSLLPQHYEALLKDAEEQTFNIESPTIYELSVEDASKYLEKVKTVLPFGKGNESAVINIKGLLTRVTPLKRKIDQHLFAYVLSLKDFEGVSTPLKVKVMSDNLTAELSEKLQRIEEKNIEVPVDLTVYAYDNFYNNSKFDRLEYRVVADDTFQDKIIEEGGEEVLIQEKLARFRFLTKAEYDTLMGNGPTFLASDGEEFTAEEILQKSDYRIKLEIDWNPSIDKKLFMLRRPSKSMIEDQLGLAKLEALGKLHGGKWDSNLRCYIITFGVIKNLLADSSEDWYFEFSESALTRWEELKNELNEVHKKKVDDRPIDIPHRREGAHTLKGFQNADLRLYLEHQVFICQNEMGTGKTIEGVAWGALRYVGAYMDRDRNIVIPEKHDKKPILIVTTNSVQGQYINELKKMIDLKAVSITSERLRLLLAGLEESKSYNEKRREEVERLFGNDDYIDIEPELNSKSRYNPISKVEKSVVATVKSDILSNCGFVVTNYDCLAKNPWFVSSFKWGGVVLDEAHEIKGIETHKTRALLGPQIDAAPLIHGDHRPPILAMSGTFTKNRPSDWFVWARLTGCDGGVYTGGGVSSAETRFNMRFDGWFYKEIRIYNRRLGMTEKRRVKDKGKPENGEELRRLLEPYKVRRDITEIGDLPPLELVIRPVASSGVYLEVFGTVATGEASYSQEIRELLDRHKLLDGKNNLKSEKNGGKNSESKVVDPDSLLGKHALISSLDKAYGILKIINDEGWFTPDENGNIKPFVIMAFHKAAAKEISQQLTSIGLSHFLMMQSDNFEKREEKKQRFQNGEGVAFVTTFGVGGTGLNLTRASRMIIANLPWTDSALAQARSRIFRFGQTHPVEILIPLLMSSIDHGVYYLLKNKGDANFKTISIDKLRSDVATPKSSTESVMGNAKFSAKNIESPQRARRKRNFDSHLEKNKVKKSPSGYY